MTGLARVAYPSEGTGTPVLIVHGLFGSARNWGAIAKRLSSDRPVVAVDMRNHAGSFRDARHDYPAMAADLAQVIADFGAPMDVVGHSMGGKAAMMLALTRPALLRRLVVADIAPVAYGHSQNHLIRAMRAMDLAGIIDRRDADARLAQSVSDPGVRAFLLQSLDLRADPPAWRLNLDVLEAQMEGITGWPELALSDTPPAAPDALPEPGVPVPVAPFAGPTLFLSGALSDYVQPEARPVIRALFPGARFAKLPGAGHWLHAEKPRDFEATLRVFFD